MEHTQHDGPLPPGENGFPMLGTLHTTDVAGAATSTTKSPIYLPPYLDQRVFFVDSLWPHKVKSGRELSASRDAFCDPILA